MKPLKKIFESGQTILWIETQNTVAFLRPVPDILVWTPCPAACLAESLRFRQVRFAALQLLSQLLLVGHIHGGSKKAFENPVREDWNTNASNIANRAVRSNDPLLYVATGTLFTHPLYGLCHEVAVLRVNGGPVLLERRGSLLRIEAIDLKQFPRPIFKKPRRIESPAPRMTETLPFCEIELVPSPRFFSPLAIFDVGDDAIPFDDVAGFISQRHAPHQVPAIFPICAPETQLVLKRLAAGNACEPLGVVA